MKTKNFLTTMLGILFLGGSSFAQPFEMGYHGVLIGGTFYAADYQHYSIEATPGGEYVLAGTLHNPVTGNTDIHLLKLDAVGNQVWSLCLDFAGFDDAALDVVVDVNDEIILTGHVCNSPNFPEMYVAKFTPAGIMISDNVIQGFPTAASSGTNIIESNTTPGHYIIGGFHADPLVMHPLLNGEAVLVEVDPALNPVNTCHLSLTGSFDMHSSINDIVDIPGAGYFATGSYQSSAGAPGVLAVMVDPALNIMNDLSFNDGSWRDQRGVSAFYDAGTDEIFLVSNHDITNNPQIRRIVGASGGGAIAQEADMNLFDSAGSLIDGSVFQIIECPWNPASLVVAGRFKFGPAGSGADNNNWLLEVDKGGMIPMAGMYWDVTSNNYESFGPTVMSPLFSTYVGPHPYIYNEEIVTNRIDMAGVVIVAPTDILMPTYGIDVVTTNFMNPLGCYDPISANFPAIGHVPDPLVWTPASNGGFMPLLPPMTCIPGQDWVCHDPTLPRGPITGDGIEDHNSTVASLDDNGTIGLTVSPNPSADIFTIRFDGEELTGSFRVVNAVGQVIYRSAEINTANYTERIDLSGFEKGVYILQFSDGKQQITQKLIKL